ncbi:SDR family oxidoreductase [Staphylococcus xylosus]
MGKFNSLNDKVVVIAGGAKNLGGLLSKSYAEHGAKLVIHHHDEHSLNEAQETLAKVEALGGQGTLFSGDLTQVKNVESLFQHAQNTFGKIDIAINTVGKVLKKPMAHTTEEEFDNMADINAKSAYFFIKYAEKAMNDNGKIITAGNCFTRCLYRSLRYLCRRKITRRTLHTCSLQRIHG